MTTTETTPHTPANAPNTAILTVDDLHYQVQHHFWTPTQHILKGVALHVLPGEILGFLGPNGSGKTTTLKAILGLIRPTRGRITLFGQPAHHTQARTRVGFMPERAYYPEHLTAWEFVTQQARLAGIARDQADDQAKSVLTRVQLDPSAYHRPMATYSKGMLQRAGLAQAIVGHPDLVILDEPMSGLDPIGRRDFRDIMLELRAQGKTVFFSTHILPDVEMICDRVAILTNGMIRRMAPLHDFITADRTMEITASQCSAAVHAAVQGIVSRLDVRGHTTILHTRNLNDANRTLDLLRQHAATIQTIQPLHGQLEDVFVTEVQQTTASRAHP